MANLPTPRPETVEVGLAAAQRHMAACLRWRREQETPSERIALVEEVNILRGGVLEWEQVVTDLPTARLLRRGVRERRQAGDRHLSRSISWRYPELFRAIVAGGLLLLRGAILVPRRDEEGRNVALESRREKIGYLPCKQYPKNGPLHLIFSGDRLTTGPVRPIFACRTTPATSGRARLPGNRSAPRPRPQRPPDGAPRARDTLHEVSGIIAGPARSSCGSLFASKIRQCQQ
jgi:hypothetical protein